MATVFKLSPEALAFERVQRVESKQIYIAEHDGSFELAVGFRLGHAQDGDGPTGLLFLTGAAALKAVFFVADSGWNSDVPYVRVARIESTWSDVALKVTQAAGEDQRIVPTAGKLGLLDGYDELAVCVRDVDVARQLRPLVIGLKELRARPTEYSFLAAFDLAGVSHPILAD